MAGTIDNALDLYGNALRGTASQRAAFLSTAVDGMLWQDTDGIRMIWRKDGALWVPAVWRWRGTTAQMNSFGANAPDGFEWFNTTDNSEYVRLGGVWVGGKIPISLASGVTATVNQLTKHPDKTATLILRATRAGSNFSVNPAIGTLPPGYYPPVPWAPITSTALSTATTPAISLRFDQNTGAIITIGASTAVDSLWLSARYPLA